MCCCRRCSPNSSVSCCCSASPAGHRRAATRVPRSRQPGLRRPTAVDRDRVCTSGGLGRCSAGPVVRARAFNAAGDRADLLRLAESLVLVWVLIRFSSQLVRDERLARVIAVLAWLVAALNIAGLITPVVGLLDAMSVPLGNFRVSLLLVLKGAVTLAIFVWIANVAVAADRSAAACVRAADAGVQVLAAKLVRMTLLTLAVVLALGSIGIDLTAFAVFSGAVGVGVGFGLQKVVSNLISGVILLMDRSIKPGDVIEIDSTLGSVIALNARYASVQTRDGKEYLIPNEDLITQRVTNLLILERPDPSARQGRNRVSLRSAQGDPAGAGGGARRAACAARACAELRAGRVRRQHGRSRTAILDPRSGERHRQCAQRRDAEHVGSVPATWHRIAASATRPDTAESRGVAGVLLEHRSAVSAREFVAAQQRTPEVNTQTLSRRADQRN